MPPVRLRAASCDPFGCPRRGARPRRAKPIPGAEQSQSPAPSEANSPPGEATPRRGRTQASDFRSPRCDSVRVGCWNFGPAATDLSKSTVYHRKSGPPRSPNPRRGARIASSNRAVHSGRTRRRRHEPRVGRPGPAMFVAGEDGLGPASRRGRGRRGPAGSCQPIPGMPVSLRTTRAQRSGRPADRQSGREAVEELPVDRPRPASGRPGAAGQLGVGDRPRSRTASIRIGQARFRASSNPIMGGPGSGRPGIPGTPRPAASRPW